MPRRAYGLLAHSNIEPGIVAMLGLTAASTSTSGFELVSDLQNATSSSSAAITVRPLTNGQTSRDFLIQCPSAPVDSLKNFPSRCARRRARCGFDATLGKKF